MKTKTKETAPAKPVKKKAQKTKRGEYIDKLTKQLKKWDKELLELETKSEKRIEKIKSDHSGRIEKIRIQRNDLKDKGHRLEEVGEETFKKIKQDVEKLWKYIQKGFSSARKELKN